MYVLYVDACPRGTGVSRTRMLAEHALQEIAACNPGMHIVTHALSQMRLQPIDCELLQKREALINQRAWDDPLFSPARVFKDADSIIIAAPYWDLMFPAMLKIYIEHLFIRELTFCYREDRPIGLCTPHRALFVTTAGSPIGNNDFGSAYLRETLAMLGIATYACVSAEGLDVQSANVAAIIADAKMKISTWIASWMSKKPMQTQGG